MNNASGNVSHLGTIDGLDLWPALSAPKHSSPTPWPRNELLVNADTVTGVSAYRYGDYKLVSIDENAQSAAKGALRNPDLQGHIPIPGGTMPVGSATETVDRLDTLMTASLAWKVLEKLNGGELAVPTSWRQRAAVECRLEISSPVPGLAELRGGYYLFDLSSDPCELNNLAQNQPLVVAEISRKLEFYEAAAQPAVKHQTDPRGLPQVNDCVWARWEDTVQTDERVCLCP
ncbi:arylsulfatase I-like [Haemaphysalis longicornis]